MATQIRTRLKPIHDAIVKQTYLALGVDRSAVRTAQALEKVQTDVDTQCVIQIGAANVNPPNQIGGGRLSVVLERYFYWNLRIRSGEQDEHQADLQGLFNEDYGHFVREEKLFDALLGFWVEDAEENSLTIHPVYSSRIDQARRVDIGGFATVLSALVSYQFDTQPFQSTVPPLQAPP